MNILLKPDSSLPIYEQLVQAFKESMLNGELSPGDMLPSIRSLAKDLEISVITTKRAYEELERQGFIYTVAAKGSFVAQRNMELLREENLKKIEAHLKEALALAASCRLTQDALCEMLRVLDEEG